MTISEIAKKVNLGELKATDLVAKSLAIIKEKNPLLNAFLEVFEEESILRAKEIDALPIGKKGLLAGVPIAIKDNILYKGHTCSCASKMLANYKAPYNASVVEKLLKEGAIIMGRTNMDEFAMGSSNENSAFGIVKNPLDNARVPGGSSGGSATAVASDMVYMALGSDTGGSIRQPSSFCGIYGIKATYGKVSRYGLTAFASSTDQIGPITKNLEDNKFILDIISGKDDKDSTSLEPIKYEDKQTLTIGIPLDFLEGLGEKELSSFNLAKENLAKKGYKIQEVSLPHAKYSSPCYYILTSAEASSNFARFDGLRYGYTDTTATDLDSTYLLNRSAFGAEVKRRIMLGTYCLSSAHAGDYYLKAQKVRSLIKQDFTDAFNKVDIIMIPTTPTGAFKIGEKVNDLLSLYLADLFTAPASLAGLPALSVPFGKDNNNMPLGIQFYGNYFAEDYLYKVAKSLENK